MNLSFGSVPGSNRIDRRAVLSCRVPDLGLNPRVADYVRVIAGGHYNRVHDSLKISIDKHADAALNKREGIEQLIALCTRSAALLEAHGPLVRPRQYPPYQDYP
jgi:predicted metal-dependent hydrolase